MSSSHNSSIVEYYSHHTNYSCGYCKSPNTNYSHGMWAHTLSVQDYQELIDRGWRRSGCYCYKPTLHLICCPMYTIRCPVLDYKPSKSQKKKVKRFNKFLAHGQTKSLTEDGETESNLETTDNFSHDCVIGDVPGLKEKLKVSQARSSSAIVVNTMKDPLKEGISVSDNQAKMITQEIAASSESSVLHIASGSLTIPAEGITAKASKKTIRPGDGEDPSRPHCKKSKLMRLERKEKKLAQLSSSTTKVEKNKTPPAPKSLEDFLNEPLPESPAHRLEIRLVRSCPASKQFRSTLTEAYEVYRRYQMVIHNDPPEKLSVNQFNRFLVNSPLQPWQPRDGPPQGYGSFHQQYWLDGRLIAVGVIDILPVCVSSVYFFYDPEFHSLVLGTYGSLREIAFCRSLSHTVPALRFYYMGYYIHSCPKMRYKGAYSPSFLLCPEVYTWHPIEACLPRLERSKYSRFNDDPQACDANKVNDVQKVTVLFHNQKMHYHRFLLLKTQDNYLTEVLEYADLVGKTLSQRMLLLIH